MQRKSLFENLKAFSEEITHEKQAAQAKIAGPVPADPGGYQGASEHASTSIDNDVQKATEGARSSENEADVKKDQGPPSVNNASEPTMEGRQDQVQLNIGTNASATGEDPSVEDNYKDKKDDKAEGSMGGTTHPATTADAEKYSSCTFKEAMAAATSLGNTLLADIVVKPNNGLAPKTAAAAPAGAAAPVAASAEAMQAGYELASTLGLSKEAAAVSVEDTLVQTILDAQTDAALFGAFYREKLAAPEDETQAGEDHSSPGDDASGAGDAAGASGAAPGGGGGGEGGGGAPPGLESLMGGGAGGGAPPMGGDVPIEAQAPAPEEALQELAMALEELGIPLDQLAAAGAAAGGGGGMDPGMGGGLGADPAAGGSMPPMGGDPAMGGGGMDQALGGGAPPMTEGAKLAAAVKQYKLSGKFQIKEARTKRARQLRDVMKQHVLELVS